MVNYNKAMIYTIRSFQTDKIYIGSTCNELRKRLHQHKNNYKLYLNGNYHYVTSFEIVKYDDCYIELYEKYPCNDKIELHKREGEIIRDIDCVNKCIAGRTIKQYRIDNKYKLNQISKQYRIDNKDKILEYKKMKYYCICGAIISKVEKARHNRSKKHKKNIFNLHNELNHLSY